MWHEWTPSKYNWVFYWSLLPEKCLLLKSVKLHNVSDSSITSLLNVISESTPPWTSALTCMWSVSRGCTRWRGAPGFIRSRRTLCTSSRRCSGRCSSWWAQLPNLKPCDWPACVRQSRFSSPLLSSRRLLMNTVWCGSWLTSCLLSSSLLFSSSTGEFSSANQKTCSVTLVSNTHASLVLGFPSRSKLFK